MNELKIFSNPEFGEIRTVTIHEEPWFVGKDVAQVLGYSNPQKAIRDHVDEDDRTVNESFTVNGTAVVLINESGLYSLILSSKLPNAKKFKRWVTSEVLPSIRSNGGYISNQEKMTPEEILANAIKVAERVIAEKDRQIEAMQPKALFADSVAASSRTLLVGELAKVLRQNGVDMGEKRLFSWLRDNGYLIKRKGTDYNMPTQRSMDMGLFRIKETVISHSDGHTSVKKTPKITGKGQQYFLNLFIK